MVVEDLNRRGKHWYESGTSPGVYCNEHRPHLAELHPRLHFVITLVLFALIFAGLAVLAKP